MCTARTALVASLANRHCPVSFGLPDHAFVFAEECEVEEAMSGLTSAHVDSQHTGFSLARLAPDSKLAESVRHFQPSAELHPNPTATRHHAGVHNGRSKYPTFAGAPAC